MNGNWAGEFGALQITAGDAFRNAVDYDGDGRRDLIHSVPDTVASAANFLKNLGWQRGQPWLQEVRLTADMPWEQADIEIQHPVSQWKAWGIRAAGGKLPADTMQASLLLPMGRFGPAFLAYPNFKAFMGWNSAFVYSTTAAYFAARLAGAPLVGRGNGEVVVLTPQQIMDLQRALLARGHEVGEVDGKMGAMTRKAVKQAQLKVGLPGGFLSDRRADRKAAGPDHRQSLRNSRAFRRRGFGPAGFFMRDHKPRGGAPWLQQKGSSLVIRLLGVGGGRRVR